MGKLCRIRLLRPDGTKQQDDGVSDSELAALTGETAVDESSEGKKKPGCRTKPGCKAK
jgi:hypothetical protein